VEEEGAEHFDKDIYVKYKNLLIILRAQNEYSRTHFGLIISTPKEEEYDIVIEDCDKKLDQSNINISFSKSTNSNEFDRQKLKLQKVEQIFKDLTNKLNNINNIKNCYFINHKNYKNRTNKFSDFKSLLDHLFS